jgi:hypothetical protein
MPVHQFSEHGTWTLTTLTIRDNARNVITVDASDVAASGGPISFQNEEILDSVTPNVVGTADRVPDLGSWYNKDVSILWTATDDRSIATTPPPTLATLEGTNNYTSEPSCDTAGNCATGSLSLSIDKTIPLIIATLGSDANAAGWHNSDLSVMFECSDAVSGIADCSDPIQLTEEGVDLTATGTALDLAGNTTTSTLTNIKIDKTAPTAGIASPLAYASYAADQAVTASYSCADAAGGSGIASCQGSVNGTPVANGAALPTGTLGSFEFKVTAIDNAGNTSTATRNYNVFGKIYGSLDATPALNKAKAGNKLDVRFDVTAPASSGSAFVAGYPQSQQIDCTTLAPVANSQTAATDPTSGATYNAGNSRYTYRWQTDAAWAGTCRQLIAKFDPTLPGYGGGTVVYNFSF